MARQQSSNNTLRVSRPDIYSSMIHPNSTSNLNSPSLYPLYGETPIRPYTSSAQQHAIAGRLRRKNMREMIGTTTEAEFDALPLAVRRKVRVPLSPHSLYNDTQIVQFNNISYGDRTLKLLLQGRTFSIIGLLIPPIYYQLGGPEHHNPMSIPAQFPGAISTS